ncbi:MAG TPA: tlde1 domain-containing protein [Candidatus Sulfotelmatobacter sp.]|nr:tlde1 domain-containing protein [Candidatus Sulfotelmatobacter sp.]
MDSEEDCKQAPTGDINAFAWTYAQKTGELLQDGKHVATGYSGFDDGKNNPSMEAVPNCGPIPHGEWTITGPPVNTRDHGPYVLRLEPSPQTRTFGRSGFLMHGDSKESPGCASHGCIILPRTAREQVWNSGDRNLEVVPALPARDPDEGVDV